MTILEGNLAAFGEFENSDRLQPDPFKAKGWEVHSPGIRLCGQHTAVPGAGPQAPHRLSNKESHCVQ